MSSRVATPFSRCIIACIEHNEVHPIISVKNRHTSLINGISSALLTKPGTSFDSVTDFPQAIAKERARSSVSCEVWRPGMSSTSF